MLVRFFRPDRLARSLPLVIWCGVIFLFSQMPGSGLNAEPPLWYVIERKSAHVFEYAVLMLLAWRYFSDRFRSESQRRLLMLSATFVLVYGMLDELHQFFIFGRGARFTDVAVDGLGIALALVLIMAFLRLRQ